MVGLDLASAALPLTSPSAPQPHPLLPATAERGAGVKR